ncbi:hypothetical protein [Scleromatobacter humisilvae]|uniref:Uncharacterized protein n=1 Tax=Scleromatobacter humisilvae TaxID=2897159 RepID=A0A9X1YG72_9BURK|nr:hypothetical protein [Scleromatobacter humisilvae]MCK9685929.1 hypothetical protein [Scleromatobacter humisilvae]
MLESLAILGYVGLVIFCVARGCRFPGDLDRRIVSAHSLADSVARLDERCVAASAMAGHVLGGSVRLACRADGRLNSFRPVFSGEFREEGAAVVLVGEFGMAAATQVFLVVWFGGLGVALARILFAAVVAGQRDAWAGGLFCALMLLACTALVRSAKRASAGDIAWLTTALRDALR